MEERVIQALAAAARAFADSLGPSDGSAARHGARESSAAGSAESMYRVLRAVAAINDGEGRGVGDDEMRAIATEVGMDPRGMAGYYTMAAKLLGKDDQGRWITAVGRERLEQLDRRFGTTEEG
jgi:hypothetical protein